MTSLRFENRVAFEDIEQIFTAIAQNIRPPSPLGRWAGDEGAPPHYSGDPTRELSIHGVEKTDETGRLCRMKLAVHGLEGDIRHGGQVNSYYDDPHDATVRFDFVLANPPFNVNAVDKERLRDSVGPGRRFPFGLPRTDNGNFLWIQLFYSARNLKGRAGFVMANSASDARSSEQELRKQLIESQAVDVMVAVGPNLFYTVTLPCTLCFLDKSKSRSSRREEAQTSGGKKGQSLVTSAATSGVDRADTVLFIDARHIYRQIDRAHREWTPAQIGFIADVVRLYRGEELDFTLGGDEAKAKLLEVFGGAHAPPRFVDRAPAVNPERSARARNAAPEAGALPIQYRDVPGLCRAATLKEMAGRFIRGRGGGRSRERRGFQGTTRNAERGTRSAQYGCAQTRKDHCRERRRNLGSMNWPFHKDSSLARSANGAVLYLPGATPQVGVHPFHQGPTARPIGGGFNSSHGIAPRGWDGLSALGFALASVPGALPQAGMGAHLWCWGTSPARPLEQTIAGNVAEILEA